jgi:Zn-dependent oligopeptidase
VAPTNAWADGVTLWVASDASTGAPLGMFYLDMFPREGKYNHFAQFDIIPGKRLPDGKHQRPVVSLVCNFTPPTDDKPSLISHDELQTLFHEFGHALHSILTQADFVAQSGTNVPRDFVEAPSQMLEAWTWSPEVLDRFAGNWQNPDEQVPAATLERMEEARLATIGVHYRRQLALATGDLRLHAGPSPESAGEIVNDAFAEVFLAVPDGTAMAAYWGHLTGYDAGYYGYAWADSIAADLESRFQNAPSGLMDVPTGMALRNEIYAVGGSREIDESIRAFLGRPRSLDPFLRKLGIGAAATAAAAAPTHAGAQWNAETRMWTLRAGDTLAGVARAVYGDENLWMEIARANRDRDLTAFVAGEQLRVPPLDAPQK